jgi:hypothetical protein
MCRWCNLFSRLWDRKVARWEQSFGQGEPEGGGMPVRNNCGALGRRWLWSCPCAVKLLKLSCTVHLISSAPPLFHRGFSRWHSPKPEKDSAGFFLSFPSHQWAQGFCSGFPNISSPSPFTPSPLLFPGSLVSATSSPPLSPNCHGNSALQPCSLSSP